jgi:hypothetical protein
MKKKPEKKIKEKVTEYYGTIHISEEGRSVSVENIINFIQNRFDGRLVTVAEGENKNYLLKIENEEGSGRSSESKMVLSEKSYHLLFSSIVTHFVAKGGNVLEKLDEILNPKEGIEFNFSKNLILSKK